MALSNGFTFISLLSGITSLSSSFYKFVTLRIMVSLGCGVAEPVGVSNTAEWWPKEHRGFAIGAHHSGYPVGALLSGVAMATIITYFGPQNWRYAFSWNYICCTGINFLGDLFDP